MKEQTVSAQRLSLALFLITTISGSASAATISFNDPAGLLGVRNCALDPCLGAPLTFANFYKESGMIVTVGVNPPDPRLGGNRYGHYHLSYEIPITGFRFDIDRAVRGNSVVTNPENEPRSLSPHGRGP